MVKRRSDRIRKARKLIQRDPFGGIQPTIWTDTHEQQDQHTDHAGKNP